MFSDRFDFDLRKNRLTQILESKREQGANIIDLTVSNPTRVAIRYPEQQVREVLRENWSLEYAPDPQGLRGAREAVSGYYAKRSCRVDPEDILLTSSTSEAYAFLFKLLTNPGETVLVPRPSYPLFDYLASMESARVATYCLYHYERWVIDFQDLRTQLARKPRALLTVSPNNPTGSYVSAADWAHLAELCSSRQIPIICDEVFFDYPLEDPSSRFDPLTQADFPSFLLNGLSKLAGLPQLKLSWIVTRGPEDFRTAVRSRLELISDTYLSVQTGVQKTLGPILELVPEIQHEILKRVQGNLKALKVMVTGTAVDCLAAEGGWSAVLRIPRTRNDEQWATLLLEQENVLVHPGYYFGFPHSGFLVVSLLPVRENFNRGVERLLSLIPGQS